MHEALTDLYAYALVLDGERQLLGERIEELAHSDSTSTESSELAQSHVDMAEELAALRETIAALRADATAAGSMPSAAAIDETTID
jgi:N-acetylglucosamine-6-phosphate deacetylase